MSSLFLPNRVKLGLESKKWETIQVYNQGIDFFTHSPHSRQKDLCSFLQITHAGIMVVEATNIVFASNEERSSSVILSSLKRVRQQQNIEMAAFSRLILEERRKTAKSDYNVLQLFFVRGKKTASEYLRGLSHNYVDKKENWQSRRLKQSSFVLMSVVFAGK